MRHLVFCVLSLGWAAGWCAAGPVVHKDLPYTAAHTPLQCLDVYSPATGDHHPVVLWIHGGGWTYGDKSNLQQGSTDPVNRKPESFTDHGYVFVAINYRLFPDASIADMESDIGQSVRWVHDHIAAYGGDGNAIVVMGHSAGAQLAALFCTDATYLNAVGLGLRGVKGCVPVDAAMYYPPLQLDTDASQAEANSDRWKFPNDGAQRLYAAVCHIWRGKPIPPFLVVCVADHPETGTKIQSEILANDLQVAGCSAEVVACPGKTHDTLNADIGLPGDRATEAIYAFLRRCFGR